MPSHYLLTTCLLSMCDLVVLSYVVRRTRRTSYVVRSHRRTVALTQACHYGRVIWAHPEHTLLGDDHCGPCVRARAEECFVAQAPACVCCTSLRNPRGQYDDHPPPSLVRNLGGLVALPCGRRPMVARGAGAFDEFTCFPNPLFFSSKICCTNSVIQISFVVHSVVIRC